MELTIHAVERIQEHTKMRIQDLLEIVKSDSVVLLGTQDDYAYLLFFSPADRRCKIAVTNKAKTDLVSVWETSFRLPPGVSRARKSKMQKASQLYKEFASNKLKSKAQQTCYAVKIEVRADHKHAYLYDAGTLSHDEIATAETAYQALESHLRKLFEVVEENRSKIKGEVRYFVIISEPHAQRPHSIHPWNHKTLKKRMLAATT